MTDDQVEKLISREIKKRDITIHDMIGLPGHGVDTHPEDKITPPCEKGIRSNRFQSFMGCDRMEEQTVVKIDLFHPVKRSVYGTATAMDILHVCLAALLFCAAAGAVFSLATNALIWLAG